MMIHLKHTPSTLPTMMGPRRLIPCAHQPCPPPPGSPESPPLQVLQNLGPPVNLFTSPSLYSGSCTPHQRPLVTPIRATHPVIWDPTGIGREAEVVVPEDQAEENVEGA